jgi:hypothetical protein
MVQWRILRTLIIIGLIISVNLLQRSVFVEIDGQVVTPIHRPHTEFGKQFSFQQLPSSRFRPFAEAEPASCVKSNRVADPTPLEEQISCDSRERHPQQ